MTEPRNLIIVKPTPETPGQRAQRLHEEARQAASDHTQHLFDAMEMVRVLATEVGSGNDAYPVGLRDLARRLALHIKGVGDNMESVSK